jgi:Protein of unknown function (DUF2637)
VPLPQLIRIRWAVRATLFLGVAASIAANVLHAPNNPISQIISAWPPLALLLTVELVSRIPMHRPMLAVIRVLSTAVIAGIAAWVSYWHMQGVALRFGETETSAYLLPVSVDGLIVVASVSLVELAGRIRMVTDQAAQATPATATAATVPTVVPAMPAPVAAPAQVPSIPAQPRSAAVLQPAPVAVAEEETLDELEQELERSAALSAGGDSHGSVRTPRSAPVSPAVAPLATRAPARAAAAVSAPARTVVTESTAPRPRRPAIETAQLADAIEAMQPGISEDELASRLNISTSRLRQVRREEAARRATLTQ